MNKSNKNRPKNSAEVAESRDIFKEFASKSNKNK